MEPTILTKSGKCFNFLSPEESDICIDDVAHALSNICRFTGHTRDHYSVASHSVMVSQIVPPKFALMGLLHDASEAFLGDVASPLKMLLPDYKQIEARVERAVLQNFGLPPVLDPEIKKADLIALAVEKRDLMPPDEREWGILRGIDVTNRIGYPTIQPKSPKASYFEFLNRFDELMYEIESARDVGLGVPFNSKNFYYGP